MDLTIQPRHQPSPAPGRDASTHNGDSDPDMDLAQRQVRAYPGNCPTCGRTFEGCICGGSSPRGVTVLDRLTTEIAYDLHVRQTTDAVRRDIAGVAA
ncbi:MAG TPA: hypothetical protein VK599_21955 [Streptosporangiaceae bacterium]|nr:hypothetical protein [Streptosporangiaceae bacterium]